MHLRLSQSSKLLVTKLLDSNHHRPRLLTNQLLAQEPSPPRKTLVNCKTTHSSSQSLLTCTTEPTNRLPPNQLDNSLTASPTLVRACHRSSPTSKRHLCCTQTSLKTNKSSTCCITQSTEPTHPATLPLCQREKPILLSRLARGMAV